MPTKPLDWLAVTWLAAVLLVAVVGWGDPTSLNLDARFASPSAAHWLGTDELGRDVLARLSSGARYAVLISGGATLLAVSLGIALGTAAGWFRGGIDRLVSFTIDLLWTVPVAVIVTLAIAATGASPGSLILAIGGVNWVSSARVVRAEVARHRASDVVRMSRGFGFGSWQILALQVAPQMRHSLLVVLGLSTVETLALETGLTFLGLRLPPPIATWGGMLADSLAYVSTAWWVTVVPSAVIVVTIASVRTLALRPAASRAVS